MPLISRVHSQALREKDLYEPMLGAVSGGQRRSAVATRTRNRPPGGSAR
ncbi:hypothetical protein [Streptomyces sp. NPDC052042]